MFEQIKNIPKRIYKWTEKLAESPHAEKSLYLMTVSEAIFFPIPPDPLLMTMIFHNTNKWIRYTAITIVATLIGGSVGYLVGWGLFESVGAWIIDNLHLRNSFDSLSQSFRENGALVVFSAALTPIPYKLVTLTAGASGVNFIVFFVASIFGRGIRFIAVGALAHFLGKKYKNKIEEYINIVSFVLVALLMLVVFLTR